MRGGREDTQNDAAHQDDAIATATGDTRMARHRWLRVGVWKSERKCYKPNNIKTKQANEQKTLHGGRRTQGKERWKSCFAR